MRDVTGGTGPHAGQPVATVGTPLAEATGALILVHGRGGSADEMLGLAELVAPPRTAWLAPQAAGHIWYPHCFIEPVEVNEPYLGSALSMLGELVDRVAAGGRPAHPDWACARDGSFEARRALPARERHMVEPFIFFDQMGAGEFLAGRGAGRPPVPAHRPLHRYLSIRGQDPAPRQPTLAPVPRPR
jgi:hypothetical protein